MLYTDIIHLFCHVHPVYKHCDDDDYDEGPSSDCPSDTVSNVWRCHVKHAESLNQISQVSLKAVELEFSQ